MTASTSTDPGAPVTTPDALALVPMRNPIQGYDWGSTSALAMLQSRIPEGGPEAELWMGAHPAGASDLLVADGAQISLPEAVDHFPEAVLGRATLDRFGPRLPFMLKVLAIARPLSVQVHPDATRAAEAFRSDGSSPYVDPFHKPEMIYALEPVEALVGFRTPVQAAMLMGRLGSDRLTPLIELLDGSASDSPDTESGRLHAALSRLVNWPVIDRAALVAEIAAGSTRVQATGNTDYREAFGWLDRLVGLHPADPMVLGPLLLDLVRLSPGQTLFVAAGMPHCYLSGLGVEILASSDNVLRAGLTNKPVETEELLRVIDTRPCLPSAVTSVPLSDYEVVWRPSVDEFQLSRITLRTTDEHRAVTADPSIVGAQILLCTSGQLQVRAGTRTVQLTRGFSAFVSADAGPLALSGDGELFRAAVGLG
ncbi:MAG TPA: mannose-6-phosphate isomerase, class I [Kineosporiaceae bacterium]|nr:mannose-6-phosphate isomerase, class I [Kineosporiaceae bacterium]